MNLQYFWTLNGCLICCNYFESRAKTFTSICSLNTFYVKIKLTVNGLACVIDSGEIISVRRLQAIISLVWYFTIFSLVAKHAA